MQLTCEKVPRFWIAWLDLPFKVRGGSCRGNQQPDLVWSVNIFRLGSIPKGADSGSLLCCLFLICTYAKPETHQPSASLTFRVWGRGWSPREQPSFLMGSHQSSLNRHHRPETQNNWSELVEHNEQGFWLSIPSHSSFIHLFLFTWHIVDIIYRDTGRFFMILSRDQIHQITRVVVFNINISRDWSWWGCGTLSEYCCRCVYSSGLFMVIGVG